MDCATLLRGVLSASLGLLELQLAFGHSHQPVNERAVSHPRVPIHRRKPVVGAGTGASWAWEASTGMAGSHVCPHLETVVCVSNTQPVQCRPVGNAEEAVPPANRVGLREPVPSSP